MEIKVLGPLEAHENNCCVVPRAAKPRQVLALLALHPGTVVPVPMIVEELWGETPPRTASATVQTYVLQLRRLIGCALADEGPRCAKEVLATRFGGYLLNVAPDDVDVNVYGRLARMGQRAFDIGDYESAVRLLRSALDTWRGGVLVDVQKGMSLSLEVTRLQESRLSVLETRIDADLQLGRHRSLISELAMLSARHPMNENLCEKYMIALYRSGRQWMALGAYRALRTTLVEELGIEPSRRLQHLQSLLLSSDPTLDRSYTRELDMLLAEAPTASA